MVHPSAENLDLGAAWGPGQTDGVSAQGGDVRSTAKLSRRWGVRRGGLLPEWHHGLASRRSVLSAHHIRIGSVMLWVSIWSA